MNKYTFIDTNVILRYLLNDDPKLSQAASKIINDALQGKINLFTNNLVIAELFYVLEDYYQSSRSEIVQLLISLLRGVDVFVPDWDLVLSAMIYYLDLNVDFEDAYSYAQMQEQGIKSALSFDKKHFRRFKNISLGL